MEHTLKNENAKLYLSDDDIDFLLDGIHTLCDEWHGDSEGLETSRALASKLSLYRKRTENDET